ncbi:MAG: hypothetical protein U9N85_05245 [Bacteroidota bacterium]|nr:hypothetical protein [Bacteroidota bacterium]
MKRKLYQSLLLLIVLLFSEIGFSQIKNVYSALLLKPGHVYLSSVQVKLSPEKTEVVKSVSLKKNMRYAFSLWGNKETREAVAMELVAENDSVPVSFNPGYETTKGVRYFYYIPEKSGLYNIHINYHKEDISEDVYLIQGLYFTDKNLNLTQIDKKYISPFLKKE